MEEKTKIYSKHRMKEILGGVSDSTLRRMLKAGEIPAPWRGTMWLADVVDDFFAREAAAAIKNVQYRSKGANGSEGDCSSSMRL